MRKLFQKEQIRMTVVASLLVLSTIGMIGLKTHIEEGDDEKTESESDDEGSSISFIEMLEKEGKMYKYNTLYQVSALPKVEKLITRLLEDRKKKEEEEIRLAKQYAKVAEERRLAKEAREAEERRLTEIARQEQLKKEEQERAERIAQRKIEREKERKKNQQIVNRGSSYQSDFQTTFYTSSCKGCSGISASGVDLRNTVHYQGYRVVAAPPHIAFYTKLRITFSDGSSMDAIVLDRGADIQGKRLDILVGSKEEAYRLGRQNVKVEILK